VVDHVLSQARGFHSLLRCFQCLLRDVEVATRSSPPYPLSGCMYSIDEGRVESCASRISWDPIVFLVCWGGFRPATSDLRLSSSATVVALVCWSFGFLA
jgi:hypothetical protein